MKLGAHQEMAVLRLSARQQHAFGMRFACIQGAADGNAWTVYGNVWEGKDPGSAASEDGLKYFIFEI